MRGQASPEMLLVMVLAISFSFLIVSKLIFVEDSVFTNASARQALASETEKLAQKHAIKKIEYVECAEKIIVNLTVLPTPGTDDQSGITAKIEETIGETTNTEGKSIEVKYNKPNELICPP